MKNMNRGKMVYCQETFQIFPSAKVAAEHHGITYGNICQHLQGRSGHAKGKHFVYIENTADLSQFFASKRREDNEKEVLRQAAEAELAKLTEAQTVLAQQIAEAKKMVKKYM